MEDEEYSRSRKSAQYAARYDRDHGQGRVIKARYGPRLSLEGHSPNGENHDNLHVARRGETRPHHQPEKMLLSPALGHLYEILNHAHAFYEGFNHGYDEEVLGIRPYAGPEILERLWTMRAKMGDRSKRQVQHHALEEDGNNARRRENATRPESSFRDCADNVQSAFDMVIYAESPFKLSSVPKGSTTDAESSSRMVKKIDTAYRGIRQSIRTAHKRQTHLTELVTEIELLLLYLDKVRNLWECHPTKVPVGYWEESEHGPAREPHDTEQAWNDD